jgi:hypothetical protein
MRKPYLAFTVAAGLLIALGASAEAGNGRGPGGNPFSPPGLTNGNGQKMGFGVNSTTPLGWSNPSTNGAPGWSGGTTPPGLGTVPPKH